MRRSWTMPLSQSMGNGAWTSNVYEKRDAIGNLVEIRRDAGGTAPVLLASEFRNAGRPRRRTVTPGPGPKTLRREYLYDEATSGVGRLEGMEVFSGSQLVAGSNR